MQYDLDQCFSNLTACESLRDLVKTKILIQHIWGKSLGSAFPGDAAVAGPGP